MVSEGRLAVMVLTHVHYDHYVRGSPGAFVRSGAHRGARARGGRGAIARRGLRGLDARRRFKGGATS